ncbi:MAG: RES domain-containing protein [Rhodospirillaceae bacterium]|nr:RES domain-containing protein [Rhodospirillaceae bacterium]
MTPLPPPLGSGAWWAWRIDPRPLAGTWDSGEGAYRVGGRWNSRGVRAVYCSLDPATAILEVAVHKGFRALDTVPHVLTALRILNPADVFVVDAAAIPDPQWLRPGLPTDQQQRYGDALLGRHSMVLIPSVVSRHSWNAIFERGAGAGAYALVSQEEFVLDPRLHVR